jgi:hypothetical protein
VEFLKLLGMVNGAPGAQVGSGASIIYSDGTAMKAIVVPSLGYAKFSDQKASGTAGGTSVAGSITQQRTLNTTETNGIAGASLAANTITLPPGTYQFRIRAPSMGAQIAKAFLYNSTDGVYTGLGGSNYCATSGTTAGNDAWVAGQFTISATKAFQIRHWMSPAYATSGLGCAAGTGQVEVYTEAEFWKVQ